MHPLFAAVQTASASSASFGLIDFWKIVHDFLVARIDTPEEREGVETAVLEAFDLFIAPKLGPVLSAVIRPTVKLSLDALLVSLAAA